MGKHVMVDLETWGKGPTAQIIALAAVKFDPEDVTEGWEMFHVAVDPRGFTTLPGLHPPFEVDPDTILWWMSEKQDKARAYWLSCTKLDLATTLSGFAEWFGPESLPTWGNGATFDNVILGHAFKVCGMPRPWSYKDDRCYRTLRAEWPDVKGPTDEVMQERFGGSLSHTALSDAQWQAWHLTSIYAQKFQRDSFWGIAQANGHAIVQKVSQGEIAGSGSDGLFHDARALGITPDQISRLSDSDLQKRIEERRGTGPGDPALKAYSDELNRRIWGYASLPSDAEYEEAKEAAREAHRKDPDLKHRQEANVQAAAAEMRALPDREEDRTAMARAMDELVDPNTNLRG